MDREGAIIPGSDGSSDGGLPPRDNTAQPDRSAGLSLVIEQKNKFRTLTQQRIDKTASLLATISSRGREEAYLASIADTITENDSSIPETTKQQIAQLEEMETNTNYDPADLEKLQQATQLQDDIYDRLRRMGELKELSADEIGPATRKSRIQALQHEFNNQQAKLAQLFGTDDSFIASYTLLPALHEKVRPFMNLRRQILDDYVIDTVSTVARGRSEFVESLSENTELHSEMFSHAFTIMKPKIDLLKQQGYLTEADAEEYIRLITDEHNSSTTKDDDISKQRAQQIKSLVDKTPGLEIINQITTGIEHKAYKDIFALLALEEEQPALKGIEQKLGEEGLSSYKFHEALTKLHPESASLLLHYSIPHEARILWEVVRSSQAAQLFPSSAWKAFEEKIVPELYSQVAFWSFDPRPQQASHRDTIYHFLSMTQANEALRQPYLPRLTNGIFSGQYGRDEDFGPARYALLNSLSSEDIAYLEQTGFSSVVQLKNIAESNPDTFNTRWFRDQNEPWKYTDNPVYHEIRQAAALTAMRLLEDKNIGVRDMELAIEGLSQSWINLHDGYGQNEPLWQDPNQPFTREDSDWMLIVLRSSDHILGRSYVDQKTRFPTDEARQQFYSVVTGLKEYVHQPDISDEKKAFLISDSVLHLLARQPHKFDVVLNTILHNENFDRLAAMMTPDGPLAVGIEGTLDLIFSSSNPSEQINGILESFSSNRPYWESIFEETRRIYGVDMRNTHSEYPITAIPTKEGLLDIQELVARHRAQKEQDGTTLTFLEEAVENPDIIKQLIEGKIATVPLSTFHGMFKERIFREYLKNAIELSRDQQAKQNADRRNRSLAKPKLEPGGLYVHATAVDIIDPLLFNGNLPKQVFTTTEFTSKNFPFHTDFIQFDKIEGSSQSLGQMISSHERIGIYGASDPRTAGTLGEAGQIFLIYDRNNSTAYEYGKNYEPRINNAQSVTGWENQRIIPGGMPSTEISALMLREPLATFPKVLNAIAENGFYIPVYDFQGNLLLSPEQYDQYRGDRNIDVPVPVWESTSKVGPAKGSHEPAGEYVLPSQSGEQRRFYVKFAKFDFGSDGQAVEKEQEEKNRVWNEFLAEKIYRHLDIPVPETSVVRVNRAYGHAAEERIVDAKAYAHASEMLPVDVAQQQEVIQQRAKNGFLVDALLANWDIAKPGNIVVSNGEVYRIDNGGALLFRARGERKTPAEFGSTVSELISMRGSYPNLEDAEIQQQAVSLRARFQDRDIDSLVNSVRLNQSDRDLLKTTLKARRDYILAFYNVTELSPVERQESSEQTRVLESLLKADVLDDSSISQIVPEWQRLTGEEGYQHNKVLLGEHIKGAVSTLKYLPEYWSLSEKDKNLALVATLFHDFGKPTGKRDSDVVRDFDHEIPSAQVATDYMTRLGYPEGDIQTVVSVILNDGIVSDIARGRVRDPRKNLTPDQLKEALGNNTSAINILRAVNRADVIATVGAEGFNNIASIYNQYFDGIT